MDFPGVIPLLILSALPALLFCLWFTAWKIRQAKPKQEIKYYYNFPGYGRKAKVIPTILYQEKEPT